MEYIDKPLSVAVVGAGYWGKNVIRALHALPGVRVARIVELVEKNRASMALMYPHCIVSASLDDILLDPTITAVAVVTPVEAHFEVAKRVLEAGKHLFIEKPFTRRVAEAVELTECARARGLIIVVGHTYLFNSFISKMKELVDAGRFGTIKYLDAERLNLGPIRQDVNVVWDLATHDIAVFNYLLSVEPLSVIAVGSNHIVQATGIVEDVSHVTLRYPNSVTGHIHVNWLSPIKLRKTIVFGDAMMASFNELHHAEKLKLYQHTVEFDFSQETPQYPHWQSGDVIAPYCREVEPLGAELEHFVQCVRTHTPSHISGPDVGTAVVRVLCAIEASMRLDGHSVLCSSV